MADTTGAFEKGQLYQLDLAHLQADPNQPRTFMDPQALEDLTESVRQHGVLMPILFRQDLALEALLVVAGERRCEAARKAGLATIPAIFVEGNHAEIALVENLLRQDLTPVEEAEALDRLIKEQSYTQEQLGAIIGKARNTVSEILSLNRLPQEVRDACRANATVGRKALIEIARKKQDRAMITAWTNYQVKQEKLAAGKQKREKTVETPAVVLQWVSKANTKLTAIDPAAWTEEEKTAFDTALTDLKKTILALLKK
jgi:ParB family transcriptional regulator, chromosome partitioning protein